MTAILGISAFYHDSAAALVIDGDIVAAAQEERFTRKKHDDGFPIKAIEYCLEEGGLTADEVDCIGFYEKPLMRFERLLETYLAFAPAGFRSFSRAMPLWLREKLHLSRRMNSWLRGQYRKRYVFTDHHESHAASAFFPSPFEEAAILTMDGVGEWATASYGSGRGNRIWLTHELRFPHSLGLLYSAFTYFCGFKVNSDEYKLMGLAPYGEPIYEELIRRKLIDLKEDGSFRMNMSYFDYCAGLRMTSKEFERLFEGPPRTPESPLTRREMDLAASVQSVTEEIMLRAARHVHQQTGAKNLCLAGGVALNCVSNGRILREGPFERIWIQPAAGDAGGAVGAALLIWHQLFDNPRTPKPEDGQLGAQLGGCYDDQSIRDCLNAAKARYEVFEDDDALCEYAAEAVADGKVVGWFQGRMEFGPRALGSRSIFGDARDPKMQSVINAKVKFREGFRPFAPMVLAEHCSEYFAMEPGQQSPYMLLVAPVRDEKRREIPSELQGAAGLGLLKQRRSDIPAVTHVDYSARVQTVDRNCRGLHRKLLEKFYARTGCPLMVNTSFNLGWEPIVESPQQACETFMSCDLDVLIIGRQVVRKPEQPAYVPYGNDGEADDAWFIDLLRSPNAGAPMVCDGGELECSETGQRFGRTDNVLQMFWPHEQYCDPTDVTDRVKAFYEETPFPGYEDHDSLRSLINKARAGVYARALERSIPHNSTVLEVGCGTGQLSNFLGIGLRRVIGADLCLNSLRLGEAFRRQYGLNRVRFVQMNLFRPAVAREAFDVVLCNGVLHHTSDPYGGFRQLTPLVKPGGYIVLGLYNSFGRLLTDARRMFFHLTKNRFQWLDPIHRAMGPSNLPALEAKRRAWFADQYCHPHESKHTVGEVLQWFDKNDIEFVRGVPSVTPGADSIEDACLFEPRPRGNAIHHFVAQMREVVAGSREGGFFVMIGRKRQRR